MGSQKEFLPNPSRGRPTSSCDKHGFLHHFFDFHQKYRVPAVRGLDFQGPLNLPIFFLTGETAGLAMGQASGRAGGRTHERKQSPAETAAAFACGYASLKERQTMISLLAAHQFVPYVPLFFASLCFTSLLIISLLFAFLFFASQDDRVWNKKGERGGGW